MMSTWSPWQITANKWIGGYSLTFFFCNLLLTFLCDKGNDTRWDVLEHPGCNTREKHYRYSSALKMFLKDLNYICWWMIGKKKKWSDRLTRLDSMGLAFRWRRWCCSQTSSAPYRFSAGKCAMKHQMSIWYVPAIVSAYGPFLQTEIL